MVIALNFKTAKYKRVTFQYCAQRVVNIYYKPHILAQYLMSSFLYCKDIEV